MSGKLKIREIARQAGALDTAGIVAWARTSTSPGSVSSGSTSVRSRATPSRLFRFLRYLRRHPAVAVVIIFESMAS